MSNHFDLPAPQTLVCHLLGYQRSGSLLEIKIYPEVGETPVRYLCFEGVVYFDGPVFWRGAGFVRASDVDCLALLRELHVHDDLPGDDLVGQFALYEVVSLTERTVRLLAIRAQIQDEPSGRFA